MINLWILLLPRPLCVRICVRTLTRLEEGALEGRQAAAALHMQCHLSARGALLEAARHTWWVAAAKPPWEKKKMQKPVKIKKIKKEYVMK
ncbi:hypothetical protein E2C01_090012 [Portunus trituberculatus]|uniref:Secreted protein n=1 Tax=Portunus trituberculatus TaxID=210409 RepID=A0A5B7JKS9_PORTR|nr:hypothetical protein [Portunus trituberculatus]